MGFWIFKKKTTEQILLDSLTKIQNCFDKHSELLNLIAKDIAKFKELEPLIMQYNELKKANVKIPCFDISEETKQVLLSVLR